MKHPVMRGKRAFRSGVIGIADQSTVALTNLLLTVFAAQGGVDSLGSFALLSAIYVAVLVLIRSMVAEPYMALGDPRYDRLYSSTSLLFCVSGGLVAAIISFFVFPDTVPWALVLLLVAVLSLYEFARIRAYASGHAGAALSASCLVLGTVCVSGILDSSHTPDRWFRLALYWLLAGIFGLVVLVARSGGVPVFRRGSWAWFRKRLYPQGKFLTFDAVGTVLVAHVGLFLIGQLGGLTDVASVRATTTLLSPVSLVFTGLTLSLTPVLAGAGTEGRRRALKTFWLLIGITSCGAVVVVGLFGKELITAFFGATAVPPDATLSVAVASVVMFSVGAPLLAQVRVRGTYLTVAFVRVVTGAMIVFLIMGSRNRDLAAIYFWAQLGQAILIGMAAIFALRQVKRE